jgi:hypothetical protein
MYSMRPNTYRSLQSLLSQSSFARQCAPNVSHGQFRLDGRRIRTLSMDSPGRREGTTLTKVPQETLLTPPDTGPLPLARETAEADQDGSG